MEIIDAAKQLQDGRAIMKQFQKLSGGKFNVEMEVFGKGEPLLFLHGLFGHTAEDSFLEELGRDFHVIAPHLPGFGESSGAEFIDDVVDAALFYHELIDELKIPSANIVLVVAPRADGEGSWRGRKCGSPSRRNCDNSSEKQGGGLASILSHLRCTPIPERISGR